MTQPNDMTPPILMRILPWRDFRPQVKHLFPTDSSFRWFLRTHENDLHGSGAMIKLRRGVYIDPVLFARTALDLLRDTNGPETEGPNQ